LSLHVKRYRELAGLRPDCHTLIRGEGWMFPMVELAFRLPFPLGVSGDGRFLRVELDFGQPYTLTPLGS